MNQPHDVLIVLSHDRAYPFHAGTLARSSIFFADLLTEPNAARLSSKAKFGGISTRWLLELVEMPSPRHPAGQLALTVSSRIPHEALCYPWIPNTTSALVSKCWLTW